MSNDEMKRLAGIVREIVKEENQSIREELKTNTKETQSISEHLTLLTETINGEVIPALDKHTRYFKQIAKRLEDDSQRLEKDNDNIERLDKRLKESETRLGIQPPPELHIIK